MWQHAGLPITKQLGRLGWGNPLQSLDKEVISSPCLSGRGIWKVFGSRPERALEMAEGGASREEVREANGCIIGVRDVNFDASHGETFVIMGLSGSGKSTLLRCVARLSALTRGKVYLEGEDLTAMSQDELRQVRRAKLSMVFQHFGLFWHRRVIDNVAYGLEVQGIKRKERHSKAEEFLDLVGLSGYGQSYPHQLSGGMQQRVGLARALVVEPTVLFFDEPFSALDPLIRRDMQDELLRIQSQLGGTIIFVTHDFDEAIKLGDRIAVMKDGQFDQVGTAAELITNPATEYVAEFVKGVPRIKVLGVRDVIAELDGSTPDEGVGLDASLEDVLPLLVSGKREIAVLDENGQSIGRIDREAVTKLLQPQE